MSSGIQQASSAQALKATENQGFFTCFEFCKTRKLEYKYNSTANDAGTDLLPIFEVKRTMYI
jgi:hypothetical protein